MALVNFRSAGAMASRLVCPWTRQALTALVIALGLTISGAGARAAELSIAVTASFAGPMKVLEHEFTKMSGHVVRVAVGSTGELDTQIRNGAPYDVFLSADQRRPAALETEGLAVAGSRFTYAVGRLALWSADPALIPSDGPAVLRTGQFRKLAMANPKTAPFGQAALETLESLGLGGALAPKIVQGQSQSQVYQFVALGAAELGFVAYAQIIPSESGAAPSGSHWLVPPELHQPILQDAVLLTRGADNEAATAFMEFLRSSAARAIIERSGYALPL